MEEIRKEVAFDDISPKDDQSSRLESGDRGSDEDAASNADDSMTGYHGENGSSSKRSAKPPKKSRKRRRKIRRRRRSGRRGQKKIMMLTTIQAKETSNFQPFKTAKAERKRKKSLRGANMRIFRKSPPKLVKGFLGLDSRSGISPYYQLLSLGLIMCLPAI